MKVDVYIESVLEEAPRLLGLLDRNPLSHSYGCFDRQYWHYRTADFACARSQEAVLTLALLYSIKHKKNQYYKNAKVLEWVNASLSFWRSIQGRDGSFSEWYPNEHAFGPTAFGVYAVSETLLLLGNKVEGRAETVRALEKAGNWLCKMREVRAQNQECGAIAALYNVFFLTRKQKYKKVAEKRLNALLKAQKSEGWFDEYNGADIGYLSFALFYLADIYKKTKSAKVLKALKKSASFLSYFVHPDFSFGGEYGSRNTEYLYPYAFEVLAPKDANAAMLCGAVRKSMAAKSSVVLSLLDDRYLSYISYIYLKSFVESGWKRAVPKPRFSTKFSKKFPEAGLFISSKQKSYFVCNYNKGGAFYLYHNGRSYSNSGIELETASGEKLVSAHISNYDVVFKENSVVVSGRLNTVKPNKMTPAKSVLLRGFQMTAGRSSTVGTVVKHNLRNRMITKPRKSGARFRREVFFGKSPFVRDVVFTDTGAKVFPGAGTSYIYIPSSRYFLPDDIETGAKFSVKKLGNALEITTRFK